MNFNNNEVNVGNNELNVTKSGIKIINKGVIRGSNVQQGVNNNLFLCNSELNVVDDFLHSVVDNSNHVICGNNMQPIVNNGAIAVSAYTINNDANSSQRHDSHR